MQGASEGHGLRGPIASTADSFFSDLQIETLYIDIDVPHSSCSSIMTLMSYDMR